MANKMRLHMHIEAENSTHVHFTVFVNGAKAGHMVLRRDEWTEYTEWLSRGKRENEFEVTVQPQLDLT
jgi:hypothetical protein